MSILSVGAVGDFKTSTNLSLQIRSDRSDSETVRWTPWTSVSSPLK